VTKATNRDGGRRRRHQRPFEHPVEDEGQDKFRAVVVILEIDTVLSQHQGKRICLGL